MKQQEHFKYSTGVIGFPVVFVLSIWLVFWFEVRFNVNLNTYGIYPRTITGLRGVAFSPFIHGSIQHLYHNSVPLFVLTTALFYFYNNIAWRILFMGVLVSGLLTWIIGRPANHIGASGLIYVLVSFIFFKGIFAKHFRLIALSLVIIFLYGSMIWYVFPIKEGVSWEGHLSGLITGLLFAVLFKSNIAKPKKYQWEHEDFNEDDDPFLKHFDENGNFVELLEEPLEGDSNETEELPRFTYTFKKNPD
jgi:membrane associated rhomboid family serine protease